MRVLKLFIIPSLLIINSSLYASPYFEITKNSDVAFPSIILTDHQAIGDYLISNVSGHDQIAHLHNLPAGFTCIKDTNASPTSCGSEPSFHLKKNEACTLRLAYTSSSRISVSQNLPMVCPTDSYAIGCEYPRAPTTFSVVSSSESGIASLTSSNSTVYFTPSETTDLVVTNSGEETANNVHIILPSTIQSHLGSSAITACPSVAAGATCTFSLPMTANLLAGTPDEVLSVEGSNTNTLELDSHVAASRISVSSIIFSSPGTKLITVTNHGSNSIHQLSITLGPGLSGVSANSTDTTCGESLAADADCVYAYNASASAYGNGTTTVSATTENNSTQSTIASISVNNTAVAINPNESNEGQDIVGDTVTGSGSFSIKNTGNFDWQSPHISHDASDTWLTFSEPGSGACTDNLAAGSSCTVNYVINGEHDLSSVITAKGENISDTNQNFEPSVKISIGIEGDKGYQHLSYRAIKVTNLTDSSQALSGIKATPPDSLSNSITLCNSTGSNCTSDYASTCADENKTLAVNESCHLWYKAENSTSLSQDTTDTIDIALTATATDGTTNNLSKSIAFTYGNDLYVGGDFVISSLPNSNFIAKWDGSNWSTLDIGTNGTVYALSSNGEDLYVGGNFTSAGEIDADYIAMWNGDSWSGLASGLSSVVHALAPSGKDMYVGGKFKKATDLASKVNRIAKWDGSNWSSLKSGVNRAVNSIAVDGNNIYATGKFRRFGEYSTKRIAKWNTDTWYKLAGGLKGGRAVGYALAMHGSDLYVGGSFTKAGTAKAKGLAKWNGNSWTVGSLNNGKNRTTRALLFVGNNLYVGGYFYESTGEEYSYNSIEKWDGSTWTSLHSGDDSEAYALATNGTNLYAGGYFKNSNSATGYDFLQKWDGSSWTALDPGFDSITFALFIAPHLSLH